MIADKDSSKLRTINSKISRFNAEIVEEPFKTYLNRRQPVKSCEQGCGYCGLKASVVMHFLREDFGGVTSVRYNSAADQVAVGYNFGYLQVFKEKSRDPPVTVIHGWEGHHSLTSVRYHPKDIDKLYASSSDGAIYRCEVSDQEPPKKERAILEENEIYSFDFDDHGVHMITGGKDAAIRVYDVATSKLLVEYGRVRKSETLSISSTFTNISGISLNFHEKRIYCVRFKPENHQVFLSGGWDGVVKVWDVRVPMVCSRNIFGPYIFGEAIDIFDDKVLTGSCVAANGLDLWDLRTGRLLQTIRPTNRRISLFGEYPYVTQFFRGDPTGDLVLAGGTDLGGLQVISIKDSRIVYLFEDDKPVLAVDSADTKITFGGKSDTLLLGRIQSSDVIDELFMKTSILNEPSKVASELPTPKEKETTKVVKI